MGRFFGIKRSAATTPAVAELGEQLQELRKSAADITTEAEAIEFSRRTLGLTENLFKALEDGTQPGPTDDDGSTPDPDDNTDPLGETDDDNADPAPGSEDAAPAPARSSRPAKLATMGKSVDEMLEDEDVDPGMGLMLKSQEAIHGNQAELAQQLAYASSSPSRTSCSSTWV